MNTMINEDVDVLARTYQGKIDPVLVSWKGCNYTVQRIESRKKTRTPKNRFETITVKVFVAKEMHLEFDHATKSWRLLTVSQPTVR
jgi:hypothetical protein